MALSHYSVRVVCKGKGTIMASASHFATLKDAKRKRSEYEHDWKGGNVRVEILRHSITIL